MTHSGINQKISSYFVGENMGLQWEDILIMVMFLGTSLAIGIYHAFTGGRQKTTEEFIMANR